MLAAAGWNVVEAIASGNDYSDQYLRLKRLRGSREFAELRT